jgi:hypothetical protein
MRSQKSAACIKRQPPFFTVSALAFCLSVFTGQACSDDLQHAFANPPQSARPLVWWHWLNGNVTLSGIDRDLEWMHRVGLGGFQMFDGNLNTPQIVDKPRLFMTPEWQEAVRYAARKAADLQLEMSITTSPGWSAAGGPWVEPDDAMKKFVWSETLVKGGSGAAIVLPRPPDVAGAFQQVAGTAKGIAPYYRDTIVLAIPQTLEDSPLPPAQVSFSAGELDAQKLIAGDLASPQWLPTESVEDAAWVQYTFEQAQTVRAVTLGIPARTGFGAPPPANAILKVSLDGLDWRPVAELAPGSAPQRTVSFAPVTAKYFRMVLEAAKSDSSTALPQPAVGIVGPPFPTPRPGYSLASFTLHGGGRVNHYETKAGFATTRDYYTLDTVNGLKGIAKSSVVNLTSLMDANGNLDWQPPPGQWQILRFGYSLTGHQNGPAVAQATGLEVDKLAAASVRRYLEHYLNLYRDSMGDQNNALRGLLADSIESGPQNWTPALLEKFHHLRGYDATPWLPTLAGFVIESPEASDRFLWDWRRTITQLVSSEYYQTLADVAHERGLKLYSEALEDNRPQLGDDISMRSRADVPMGAMWVLPPGGEGRPTYLADVMGAASSAHLYGRKQVGAETFGAFLQPWAFSPRDLKRTADLAMALGVNLFNIHTSPHQPLEGKPGIGLAPFLGQYFSRHETWAENARPWIDYLARSSYLLQQGKPVSDVLYFYGEEAPLTSLYGQRTPNDLPTGYGFDFINADSLQTLLSVKDGDIWTSSGQSYRLLYLGGSSQRMTLATLKTIRALVAQGATLVGNRPSGSPSEGDNRAEFEVLADQLWPKSGSIPTSRGRVITGVTAEQALTKMNAQPDLRFDSATPEADLRFQHRRLDDGSEIYFIANLGHQTEKTNALFRVQGMKPEIWDADSASIDGIAFESKGTQTHVALELASGESRFVVFRHNSRPREHAVIIGDSLQIQTDWVLSVDAPDAMKYVVRLPELISWTEATDPRLKYFSGTATYSGRFELQGKCFARCYLDLGDVRDLATLTINNHPFRTLWKPPYRVEASKVLVKGWNTIEVKVINPWVNRLIGDAQPGAKPQLFSTAQPYKANAALRPSGMIGPVTIAYEKDRTPARID